MNEKYILGNYDYDDDDDDEDHDDVTTACETPLVFCLFLQQLQCLQVFHSQHFQHLIGLNILKI